MTIDLRYGDTIEQMRLIPDKSIDFICCDLPYGTTACVWDVIIPFDKLWEQYNRIIKDNGAIVLFGSQPFTSELIHSNLKLFRYEWIWEKHKPSNFALAKRQPMKYHENILVFYKKQPLYNPQMIKRESERIKQGQEAGYIGQSINHGELNSLKTVSRSFDKYDANLKLPSSILKINAVQSNSKEKVNHPTQKPVALLEYLIKTYTNEGETVLDNCMGSGSTGIACINTDRNFIGIENNMDYFNISLKRVEEKRKEKDFNLITSFGDGM